MSGQMTVRLPDGAVARGGGRSATPIYDATLDSHDGRFLWLVGLGPYPGPLPRPQDTTEPPAAGEVQAGEPGPATADGTIPVGSGAEAGPGDAHDSAPGTAQEHTDPDVPPSGPAPDKAAVPGAEQGGES